MLRVMSLSLLALFLTGCVGRVTGEGGHRSGPGSDAGQDAASDSVGHRLPDSGLGDTQPGVECTTHAQCGAGVCIANQCCPSQERACGDTCCNTGQVCFANACVTPGAACVKRSDCGENEYCEPALGAGSNGGNQGGGATCINDPPPVGACVALPPRCDSQAEPTPDCLPSCEFRPSVGKLNAVEKWAWNAKNVTSFTNKVDVWSTPVVGRVTDTNCDGKVDEFDPPNIIFISGDAKNTYCADGNKFVAPFPCVTGVLRALDGKSGEEIWSIERPFASASGFAGVSPALADIDRDGKLDVLALASDGSLVAVDQLGQVTRVSDAPVPDASATAFGWGGGLAVADMDGDGAPEVAYSNTVFTTRNGGLTKLTSVSGAKGGGSTRALTTFANIDGVAGMELVAGKTAYQFVDGSPPALKQLWHNSGLNDGFPGTGDFDKDGAPEIVLVANGQLLILNGADGTVRAGPTPLPDVGHGGPPTIADFDGDGVPEIGTAQKNYYTVWEVDFTKPDAADRLTLKWQTQNHDLSSSVTGSTVFDFEGDGRAEVIYADECFLWVYDGETGSVRFAALTSSFTGTETSLVADVDGDGHAEIVMISNRINPNQSGWKCNIAPWNQPDPNGDRPAWVAPTGEVAYSGITVWGDKANSWVGTRTLWNQHTYHVSNICSGKDSACSDNENTYGWIPSVETPNWTVGWLNNFRQNVQEAGLFDAPDATVSLSARCSVHVKLTAALRNLGQAVLPAGVRVGLYVNRTGTWLKFAEVSSPGPLFPGQLSNIEYQSTAADNVTSKDTFKAVVEPSNDTFNECRTDNNESSSTVVTCIE